MKLVSLKTYKKSADNTLFYDDQNFPKNFTISFHDGLNIILGEKQKNEERKDINNIGKSAVVEFINYCLGANKDENTLFCVNNSVFDNYVLCLTYSYQTIEYTIYRTFKETEIFFDKNKNNDIWENKLSEKELEKQSKNIKLYTDKGIGLYTISLQFFKEHLQKICFGENTYGLTFRELIISNVRVRDRINPIHTLGYLPRTPQQKKATLLNLFLLGFHTDFLKLLEEDFNVKEKYIDKIIDFHQIRRGPGISTTGEIKKKLEQRKDRLNEIDKILNTSEQSIQKEISSDGTDILAQLKNIRIRISEYYTQMNNHEKTIQGLKEQLEQIKQNDVITDEFITNIFDEVNLSFTKEIKSDISEVQEFFNTLYKNRDEILNSQITKLTKEKNIWEEERKILFKEKSFFEHKLDESGDKSIIKTIFDHQQTLSAEKGELKGLIEPLEKILHMCEVEKSLKPKLENALEMYKNELDRLSNSYKDLFNATYQHTDGHQPSISFHYRSKIQISDTFSVSQGAGYTAMAYMIYDLWKIKYNHKISGIQFLIHDDYFFSGINDIDKISKYIELVQSTLSEQYQYIVILSETEITSELKKDIIENNKDIIKLSSTNLLFGKKF